MELKIEIVERENIKPSSPTPNERRRLQFSFLDQIAPQIYNTRILFYPRDDQNTTKMINNQQTCESLKRSLSKTLTHFFPLAGRIKENRYIDCNDEGALFIEALAKCNLAELVQGNNLLELNKLLPLQPTDVDELALAVQVNFFDCGGMAISVCTSHKIADALSFIMFINSWANTSCGNTTEIVHPQFEGANFFPPKEIPSGNAKSRAENEKITRKRLVFSAEAIASIKGKFDEPPTRVEALSTFLWSSFVAATQGEIGSKGGYIVTQAVNLRKRMSPPLPDNYFGNFSQPAIACIGPNSDRHDLINRMRDAIREFDGNYMKQIQEDVDIYFNRKRDFLHRIDKGELIPFHFSSLCTFPIYEADFGWGKPSWAWLAPQPYKNVATFMSTQTGGGIEVWINMNEEDMKKFEQERELLQFISPTSAT